MAIGKRVTRNNILKFIELSKKYYELKDNTLKDKIKSEINDFIINVINKDKHYYNRISSYNIPVNELKYIL